MNEKDLGKELLRGEGPIDLEALTQSVLRRDRRRMWLLGLACVFAWMLVVMLPWATILPMLAKIVEQPTEMGRITTTAAAQQDERSIELLQIVKQGTVATFLLSIASMFLAAICTVSLIILSRRATLRQVNARLAEISAQLKMLTREPR
jgi:ABC-type Fe3+ transport system permease subunit